MIVAAVKSPSNAKSRSALTRRPAHKSSGKLVAPFGTYALNLAILHCLLASLAVLVFVSSGVTLVITLVVIALTWLARGWVKGAMVFAELRRMDGRKAEEAQARNTGRASLRHTLPLDIIFGTFAGVVIIAIYADMILAAQPAHLNAWQITGIVAALAVLLWIAASVGVIYPFASIGAIMSDLKTLPALEYAFHIYKEHLGTLLQVAFEGIWSRLVSSFVALLIIFAVAATLARHQELLAVAVLTAGATVILVTETLVVNRNQRLWLAAYHALAHVNTLHEPAKLLAARKYTNKT